MSYLINPFLSVTEDDDCVAFYTAAGITDETQQNAVCQLVTDLKDANIWTKMVAVYPFVGGNATAHKYNLKNPLNTDAAFRIVWGGQIIHNANGITGNGTFGVPGDATSGYGDTKIQPDLHLATNDTHISVYCRTVGGNSDPMWEVGVHNGNNKTMMISLKNQGANGPTLGIMYHQTSPSTDWVQKSDPSAQGFWLISRRSATDFEGYKNGVSFQTNTNTVTGVLPDKNLYILGVNDTGNGLPNFVSNRNLAFVSIGAGLTDSESTAFNTAVQVFQTALGRQV